MIPQDLTMEDIHIGDRASFSRTFTETDVANFAMLSGDENPLHTDESYASTTIFGRRVIHGMLLGSLCSRFVGMHIPGKRCLYLSQQLAFKLPVFIGDIVEVVGTVLTKSESTRLISISIIMKRGDDIVVEGTAFAQVL